VQNITSGIIALAGEGAQHILVPNMSDLGAMPEFRGTPEAAGLTALTLGFNAVLAGALASLDLALSAEVMQFDTYGFLQNIRGNPTAYGFSNVTDQCILNLGNPANPCDPSTWLFWDGAHPTTAVHRLLGAQFAAAVPEPASLLLFGLGVLALGWSRRRRPS
jgi:phospholipase/lecithinase/hemolysin